MYNLCPKTYHFLMILFYCQWWPEKNFRPTQHLWATLFRLSKFGLPLISVSPIDRLRNWCFIILLYSWALNQLGKCTVRRMSSHRPFLYFWVTAPYHYKVQRYFQSEGWHFYSGKWTWKMIPKTPVQSSQVAIKGMLEVAEYTLKDRHKQNAYLLNQWRKRSLLSTSIDLHPNMTTS